MGRVALILLTAGAIGCLPGRPEQRWVAQIDGEVIRYAELERLVEGRLEANPALRREDVVGEELQQLVSDQLVLNRARELEVKIHDAEVERRIRAIHGDDFSGSDPTYVEEVRRQMILERTPLLDLVRRLSLSESALQLHYEEHRGSYRKPAQVQIRQIVVEDLSAAERLRTVLADGADFPALAAEYSLAPEAGEGGLLPPFAQGELPEVFDQAFELKGEELSRVIESPYGFHIFRLESKVPPHEPEFGEVRDQIAFELQEKRLGELQRDWLRGLRRRAEIRVNDRLLEELR